MTTSWEQVVPTLTAILRTAWGSAVHMSPYLAAGLLLAAAVHAFVPQPRLKALFLRAGVWPVVLATAAAVTTPLCSCTTVSVMIPLLAAGVPWGPVFAWLIASPIVSPTGFMLVGGTLGWDMAVARVLVATVLGIAGGLGVDWLARLGWLTGQSRVMIAGTVPGDAVAAAAVAAANPAVATAVAAAAVAAAPCGAGGSLDGATVATAIPGSGLPAARRTWLAFGDSLSSSARTLVPIYALFLVVAAAIRVLVPNSLITSLFGAGHNWAIPVAAVMGMPLYTSIGSAVPMVTALVELGMARSAALAFLLTGPGTSLPALGALLAVARGKVVALYLGLLLAAAIAAGVLFAAWS